VPARTERGGQRGDGRGERRVVLRPADDQPARGLDQLAREFVDHGTVGQGEAVGGGREGPAIGATGRRHDIGQFRHSLAGLRHERLAEREVEVDRPARRGGGGRDGPRGGQAHLAQQIGGDVRDRQRVEPLDVPAVEADLVDRLRRAEVLQLGRAVGGQHDQRYTREERLDHGGVEVGGGGAGAAQDRDRRAGRPGHPEREEGRRALIDVQPDADSAFRRQRDGERRRARAGADDRVAHARARQFGDERPGESGVARPLAGHASTPSAARIGRSFSAVSTYSASGTESPMMPAPA
jgi:hypothetical protein